MNKGFISLGSNEGQRIKNIQESVVQIQKTIGVLTDLSSLYQTPSWGFDGPDFLNACVGIKTKLSPAEVLGELLAIEQQLGRVRTKESGYSSRSIDLDLLFYEDQIIESEDLILPHPRLELRNFILHPMREIAPNFVHPSLEKNMLELSKICVDPSLPQILPLNQWTPDLFTENQMLVLEGNIGVGKTSLAQKIASDYPVAKLLENFSKNPYLEKFYKQPERYALPLENYFLEDRYRQFNRFFQNGLDSKIAVADHSLLKSLIFAKINLSHRDYNDFKNNYKKFSEQWEVPQKVIFLYRPIDELLKQIKSRGRSYEQNISIDYLEKIDRGYQDFFKTESSFEHQKIDLSDLDFIDDQRAYQLLLQRIKAF